MVNWNFMQSRNSARGALWSGISRLVDKAPWKTPDQLVVERDPQALHDPAHGQTLPVFMGTSAREGIVFWRDGPHIETTVTTETETPWKYGQTLWNFGDSWPAPDSQPIVTTTTTTVMFVSFAVAHSFNQFQRPGDVLKVEFDDIVVYDALDDTALPNAITMRVYDGIDNAVDPTMLAKDGAALTPAYHGLRYLFFEEIDLAGFDGKIPASIRILWGDAVADTPPDWLIIRYIWSDGGNDFDTRTQMIDPRTGAEMGWSRASSDLPYGNFSGDNTADEGMESCWFDLAKLREDFPGADQASIVCKGFWYAARFSGDVTIEIEKAWGGTITQDGFRFDVAGATSTQLAVEQRNVTMEGSSDLDGELLLTVDVSLSPVGDVGTVTLADELITFSKYDDDRGGLLTDAQVSTVGLAGIVNGGVIIDSDTDLREVSNRLAELYGVVKVETATGVKWVRKATDGEYVPDVVLTEADLAEERRGDAVVKIATRHRNPKEVPAEIEVRYISSDADYEPMPARAAWPQGVYDTAMSLLKRSLSVPVVLTDQQALELAWGVLARKRAADRTHSIKLRPRRLKAEPSDVFELTAGGQKIVGQFTKQTKLPDHSLEMTAEGYLSRAATTVAAESPIVHVLPPPSFETTHVFLDGPLLLASHDTAGASLIGYSVLTGLEGWVGGSLYRRRSGETSWTKVGDYAGAQPVVGTLTAPLAASPSPFETDIENELTFQVTYGDEAEIAAQTEAQFAEAASVIAVGAPGRWNFVTYRNKTVNGDGTITLDTLRQGLKGTEVHEGTSLAGDQVVLVKLSHALRVPYDLADLGQSVELKATGWGVHPNAVTAQSFTVSGTAETPYAPTNLGALVDGDDFDLFWDRRTRLAGWADDGDASAGPMGEAVELYKVEILDGLGGSVLRTYDDVATSAMTYPEADILADFGTAASGVSGAFRVQQWSAAVGWGYPAEALLSGSITADTDLYTADTDELTADH